MVSPRPIYHYSVSGLFQRLIQTTFQLSLTILCAIGLGEYLALEVGGPLLLICILTNNTLDRTIPYLHFNVRDYHALW